MEDVDWQFYSRLLRAFEAKPGHRLAYDRGRLEIMAPSFEHDDDSRFISHLILALAEELGWPIRAGGSVTMRRKAKQKGIEGDESFWIASQPQVIGVRRLNLKKHPPPDLCLEVDVSRSSLNRFGIYASLGIPEVWRLEGDVLKFYGLANANTYQEVLKSLSFQFLTPEDLLVFIHDVRACGDVTAVTRRFREWAH